MDSTSVDTLPVVSVEETEVQITREKKGQTVEVSQSTPHLQSPEVTRKEDLSGSNREVQ